MKRFLSLAITSLFVALAFAGCGLAGSKCHSSSDCAGDLACSGPNDPPACGIPPRQDCNDPSGCPQGEVCNAIDDPCSASGIGSECGAPCGACADGFRCNAGGACEAVPCDEGFTCPAHQKCDQAAAHAMGPVFAQNHGCVNISCNDDGQCPSGKSCVNGFCQDGAGSCVEVMLVP